MDVATQAEIILRDANYDTWTWTGASAIVTCFENVALIGFLHVFPTIATLLDGWKMSQQSALTRHATSLRASGSKAWNVYSVFLTPDTSAVQIRAIERLEEDFSLTRKIVRSHIQTKEDIENALLPLISIRSKPLLAAANFEDRLRSRLKDVPADAVTAFLNETSSVEVARILGANT